MTKLENKSRNKFRDRKKHLDDIIKNKPKRQFNNKLVVIGSGGIGTSVIPLLREFINIPFSKIYKLWNIFSIILFIKNKRFYSSGIKIFFKCKFISKTR